MMPVSLLLALAAAAPALPPSADLEGALLRLGAAQAAERRAAERWLSLHARPADAPRLATFAQDAPLEVRGRLCAALSERPDHFGLAVALALAAEPRAAEVGRSALRARMGTYWDRASLPPLAQRAVPFVLGSAFSGELSLDPARGGLRHALDRVARLADATPVAEPFADPVSLVLDPALDAAALPPDPASARVPARLTGTWDRVVLECAALHGATALVYGAREELLSSAGNPFGAHPFVLLAPESRRTDDGFERLLEWIVDVARPRDPESASASARALAATGWPEAIEWLGLRWTAGDANALAGVLLAAGRGAVAPALSRPGVAAWLLDGAPLRRAAARGDDAVLAELVRALAAAGGRGPRGEDLLAHPAEWGDDPVVLRARRAWARLLRRAPEAWRAEWRAFLASDRAAREPAAAVEVLRTLAATAREPDGALAVREPLALLDEAARGPGGVRGLLDALDLLGVATATLFDDPARLAAGPAGAARLRSGALGALLEAQLVQGARDTDADPDASAAVAPTAALLVAVLAQQPDSERALGEALLVARRRVGEERVRALFEHAERASEPLAPRLDRVALLAGAATPAQATRVAQAASAMELAAGSSETDALVEGALLARADGAQRTDRVLGALEGCLRRSAAEGGSLEDPPVLALERALADLAVRGEKARAAELARRIRRLAASAPHPLRLALTRGAWPRAPAGSSSAPGDVGGGDVRDLEALDRPRF